ncbi:MAG: DUF2786 domain-containing protein [Actinomycetia bacterium]|nr:DUF2786 domain-containing protein [Actinomycetes bacterium]
MFEKTVVPDISDTHEAADALVDAIAALWPRGWTPIEVVRAIDKLLGREHRDIAAAAVLDERRANPTPAVQQWIDQLDEVASRSPARSLAVLASSPGIPGDFESRLRTVTTVLARLPRMAFVCDPPGSRVDHSGGRARSANTAKILERIRAMLAKAEATTFPEEAEAFTVKAQQMMSRHSIELAMLDDPDGEAPAAIRIWHEAPYASAKGDLLSSIASANGCRTVLHPQLQLSTVFGFRHELDAVELLHTSLLVQAVAEMGRLEREWQHDRRRIRSFRHSFLLGFGARIGERLREVRSAAERNSGIDENDLLPVMASRDEAVEKLVDHVFPRLGSGRRSSLSNPAGFHAGTIAADKADLGRGSKLSRGRAG